jgi:hypothetical protein
MAWDFLSPEWREKLRPDLDEAERLIAAGVMTREQAEATVRSTRELALAAKTGVMTREQAKELSKLHALAIYKQRGAN